MNRQPGISEWFEDEQAYYYSGKEVEIWGEALDVFCRKVASSLSCDMPHYRSVRFVLLFQIALAW